MSDDLINRHPEGHCHIERLFDAGHWDLDRLVGQHHDLIGYAGDFMAHYQAKWKIVMSLMIELGLIRMLQHDNSIASGL